MLRDYTGEKFLLTEMTDLGMIVFLSHFSKNIYVSKQTVKRIISKSINIPILRFINRILYVDDFQNSLLIKKPYELLHFTSNLPSSIFPLFEKPFSWEEISGEKISVDPSCHLTEESEKIRVLRLA